MFTLLSGPFHPYLESKLVEVVQQIKAGASRAPLAIVVPSESLRRRLQWLLCVEKECALFDVHFLTFHQLALRLEAERRAVGQPDMFVPSLELVGDVFYEYTLSLILEQDSSVYSFFTLHAESSGLRPALSRTIQDLQEAQVEPAVVLRGLQEGLFDELASQRLEAVLKLQEKIQVLNQHLGVGLPDGLTHSVIPWVAQSPFIANLSSILYYGFYDITQVQLSLLEEVARANSVTVFFPLIRGEASQFAQRFLDRHLLKAGVRHHSFLDNMEGALSDSKEEWVPQVQLVNAVGPEGELTFTCKSILQHREQMGYAWHEIGVVVRSFEPYRTYFPRILRAHQIPFGTTATRSLLEEPIVKVWWTLCGLREEQFGWRNVLDVLSSPWYLSMFDMDCVVSKNINIWVQAIHHFRIVGGQDDWSRLCHVAQDTEAIKKFQTFSGVSLEQASESLQVLAENVSLLISDCCNLPAVGSMSELTQAFERLVETHLCWPTDLPPCAEDESSNERSEGLMNGFEQVINSLQQLDRLNQQVTWAQWMEWFRIMLERIQLPFLGQHSMGVQVLDVMEARGRPFKILFVLGMNDHVFPRVVREDAFLRDQDRKVLAESLGYKIDEKMMGFDEEALLFALLQQAAKDHVYFLCQRSDQHGRPLIPSSFLGNYLGSTESERTYPVGLLERSHVTFLTPGYSTPQEARLGLILEGESFKKIVSLESPWWNILQNGMEMMARLEGSGIQAGPFDGITEVKSQHGQDLLSRGLTPTALGTYAQCPMRYWMAHVLKVQEGQGPMSEELPGRIWGELVHQVLCGVYQDLSLYGWPQRAMNSGPLVDIIKQKMQQVFEEYGERYGTGYPLLWQWMKTRLTHMIVILVKRDQKDFIEQGWIPEQYEIEAEGVLPDDSGTQPGLLKIRGRFDRVDQVSDCSRVRIVDYKVSMRRSFQPDELDLINKALQGRQLQSPLYSLMKPINSQGKRKEMERPVQSVDFLFLRPMLQDPVRSASFSGTLWDTKTGEQMSTTIQDWIQGIHAGQFFILPGTYCRSCPYATACRFQHHPSWSRAYRLPLAKAYRLIRKQKASND